MILVRRLPASKIVRRLDLAINTGPFQDYANAAGIRGSEKLLLQAYLSYLTEVLWPPEQLPIIREVIQLLTRSG